MKTGINQAYEGGLLGTVNPTNLIYNGDFEAWSAGTSVAPDGWAITSLIGGGTCGRESGASNIKTGTYSAKVKGWNSGLQVLSYNFSTNHPSVFTSLKGRAFSLSVWVKTSVSNDVYITLTDSVQTVTSSRHTGSGAFELLTITGTLSPTASTCTLNLIVTSETTTAYFDGVMFIQGSQIFAFSPKPAEEGVWYDYSAISTINGWTSLSTKFIKFKKIGDMVYCCFDLAGTSNAATTQFSLPYKPSGDPTVSCITYAIDNNGTPVAALLNMQNAGNGLVGLYKDVAGTNFTASGGKQIRGEFFFHAVNA